MLFPIFTTYFLTHILHTLSNAPFKKVLSSTVDQCILHNKLVVVVVPSAKTSGTFWTGLLWQSTCLKCHQNEGQKLLGESRIKDGFIIGSTSTAANFVNGLECKSETEIGHETAASEKKKEKLNWFSFRQKVKKFRRGSKMKSYFNCPFWHIFKLFCLLCSLAWLRHYSYQYFFKPRD